MRLIVGGRAQGKRAYLLTQVPARSVADGESCPFALPEGILAVEKLHLLARRWLAAGKEPVREALALLENRPEIIFVCDEVGCGIVPMDHADREWREAVGRMCCALARRAELVERVVCGIPQVLLKQSWGNDGGFCELADKMTEEEAE